MQLNFIFNNNLTIVFRNYNINSIRTLTIELKITTILICIVFKHIWIDMYLTKIVFSLVDLMFGHLEFRFATFAASTFSTLAFALLNNVLFNEKKSRKSINSGSQTSIRNCFTWILFHSRSNSAFSFFSVLCLRVLRPSCILTPYWKAALGSASLVLM